MKHVLNRLCSQVRDAQSSLTPLYIHGGNTKMFYGEPVLPDHTSFRSSSGASLAGQDLDGVQRLDMTAYRGVISYQPSELVMTVRAGTPLSEIVQILAEKGQVLAFEPPRFGAASTIGGCVASGLSGPGRMAAGSVSDYILGARLIHHSGEALMFGGEVMKNVAGYDVSRLLAGSMGRLGPIAELSIKVMPMPAYEETRQLDVSEAQALALMTAWRRLPLPISATAWMEGPEQADNSLYVRLSGSEPAVAAAVAHVGGDILPDNAGPALWNSLRDQTHPFFQERPLWRVAVPPASGVLGLGKTLIEWNGGLRWLFTRLAAKDLRREVEACGGHATLYRYDGKPGVPVFHPLSASLERINQSMLKQFDPAGVFSLARQFSVMQERC